MKRMPGSFIALMFAMVVISYTDRTVLSIAAPSIMKEFAISKTEMGGVFSAFLVSYALLMVPGGRLADRFGPRTMLAASLVASGVLTALLAFAGSPGLGTLIGIIPSFVAIRLAFGAAQAPVFPSVNRANASWAAHDQHGFVQGAVASGAGLGSALSPMIFAWVVARYGWRPAFVAAGAVTVCAGLLWYAFARDRAAPDSGALARPPWGDLLRNRNLLLLTLGFTALDYFEYIFFYWTYYYFIEIRKVPAQESAIYTTILYLAWLVMTPFGGKLSDTLSARMGRLRAMRTVVMACLLTSAVLLIAAAASPSLGFAVAAMSLAFGLASCADVNFWAGTIEVAGKDAGAAGGILNMGGNLGGGIAPWLTPLIAQSYGWSVALYVGAGMAVAAALSWLFLDAARFGRREGAPLR